MDADFERLMLAQRAAGARGDTITPDKYDPVHSARPVSANQVFAVEKSSTSLLLLCSKSDIQQSEATSF